MVFCRRTRQSGPLIVCRELNKLAVFLLPAIVSLLSCGGGGSNGATPDGLASATLAPSALTFPTISLGSSSAENLTLTNSTEPVPITLSVKIDGPFSETNDCPSPLPAGASCTITVTFKPQSQGSASGSLSVTDNAVNSPQSATLSGTGGLPAAPATSPHPPLRTRYLRTDSQYSSGDFPPHLVVYDATHKRFFMSNTDLHRIDVFDGPTETQIGSIFVPLPFGLDVAPDGSKLYVSTSFGDVYLIDPATLTVLQRYPSATLGAQGFPASEAFVLANGQVALLGAAGGLSVDGYSGFAIWNPTTNTLKSISFQTGQMAVSADRTKVFVSSPDSDDTVLSYDTGTGATIQQSVPVGFIGEILPSADGTRLYVASISGNVAICDPTSLAILQTFTLDTGIPGDDTGLYGAVLSQDGSTFYGIDFFGNALAYDTASLTEKGWVTSFTIPDYLAYNPVPSAIDETGLIAAPIGHGIAFLDGAQIHPGTAGTYFDVTFLSPDTGPISGNTVAQNQIGNFAAGETVTSGAVYFGNGVAPSVTLSPGNTVDMTAVTPNASYQGPADFTLVLPDQSLQILPEGFSYGPTIVEVSTTAATAEGGGQGVVFGYGLGQQPSDVQITVGGQSAAVTQVIPEAAPVEPYPFPMEVVFFTIPPGSQGDKADLALTNSNGSAKVPGAIAYTAALQSYPLPGSSLSEGLYDSHRAVMYFADQAQIQVFSPVNKNWVAPIPISYAAKSGKLQALALSPDGNTLAISDSGNGNIYTLNPSTPAMVSSFHVLQGIDSDSEPCGLAVTDSGTVYYASYDTGGTGAPAFHQLDTSTGVVTDLGQLQDVGGPTDAFMRVLMSPDQSKVYINNEGYTYVLQTSDNSISFDPQILEENGSEDMTLSGDGTVLESTGFLTDANLDPVSHIT
jgi:DNA-binding beta-propeller fold protein YncE